MNGNEVRMQRRFWDIPSAAVQAGYSSRHFRRIIEEEGIPVMRIGRKHFILGPIWKTGSSRIAHRNRVLSKRIKNRLSRSNHF